MGGSCNCGDCEKSLQPYVDRELTPAEAAKVEAHLAKCGHCRRCYEFEATLRRVVKRVLAEPMPSELKTRLATLRTPL